MILLLFLGNTQFDSRSRKFIEAINSSGQSLMIAELQSPSKNFIKNYLQFARTFLSIISRNNISQIICMDVFVVPFALIMTCLKSIPFHFDARELNAEVHAFKNSSFKKQIWGFTEQLGFVYSNSNTTVNESIRQLFIKEYRKEPIVILNYPHQAFSGYYNLIRERYQFPPDDFIWIFQGGIQNGRGVETAIEFITNRPENERLVFIGEKKITVDDLYGKVFFTGQIANSDLLKWTSSGNAGLIFIEDSTESYRLSLPNKFFEYIFAEIPVLSFDLPEINRFMQQYSCGIITSKIDLNRNADHLKLQISTYKTGCQSLKTDLQKNDQITRIKKLLFSDYVETH